MEDGPDSQDEDERFSLNVRVEEVEKKLNLINDNVSKLLLLLQCNNSDK